MIEGNPDVDEIWEIPLKSMGEVVNVWNRFEQEALERKRHGEFDDVYFTQIAPGNLPNYDGTIRTSIFRGYPKRITVPVTPVLRLSQTEVDNVRRFVETHRLASRKHVILFESSPKSGQSFVTPDFAREVVQKIVSSIPNVSVILSSNVAFASRDDRIIDGSSLSLKENAELTKYCSLLVGCSSGISWLCTSDWAKPLPTVQLLKKDVVWFNSFVCDHEQWGLPTGTIIEMLECSAERVYQCIMNILTEGFARAKVNFHTRVKVSLYFFQPLFNELYFQGNYIKCIRFILLNIKRHGALPVFVIVLFRSVLSKIYRLIYS
jgi:hypothetical protein